MSDLVNALNQYTQQNRNSGVLNQIANPTIVNPANALTNALTTAALLKYVTGQGGATRPTAVPGNVSVVGRGNQPTGNQMPVVPIGADGKPLATAPSAAPAATSAPARPTAAASSSPGWFVPTASSSNQGGSVYVGPQGQHYINTSPPTLPYAGWQQPTTDSATANPVTSPTSAYSNLAASVLRDPSDAGVRSAFSTLSNTGFGVYAEPWRDHVLTLSPDQRRAWAQALVQPTTGSAAPTVSIPSNATDIVRNQLNQFRQEADTGLNVSPN